MLRRLRRGPQSLRFRVNLAVLATFVVVVLVFGAFMVPMRQHNLDQALKKAQVLVQTLVARDREALANEIFEGQTRATRQRLAEMRKVEGILAIQVYDAQGKLHVAEGDAAQALPALGRLPDKASFTRLEWQGHATLRALEPIELVGERIGYIDILYSLRDVEREQVQFAALVTIMLAAILLAMAGLLNVLLGRMLTAPIARLAAAMRQVEGGALGSQVALDGEDEVGSLARAFNRMSSELKLAVDKLADANTELESRIAERTAHLNQSLDALQRTQHQLIQQEKMASLGQLVANVAHEINTPIAAVKSSGKTAAEAAQLALRDLPVLFRALTPEQQDAFDALLARACETAPVRTNREERELVRRLAAWLSEEGVEPARHLAALLVPCQVTQPDPALLPLLRDAQGARMAEAAHNVAALVSNTANINTAVERVSKIVFALKAYTHMDPSGARQPVDVREGLETVLTIYSNQIKQGIELVRRYENVGTVPGFADELNQVWTNLIHNALQAMKYRGTLTVGVATQGEDVMVTVADNGCGIPAALQAKIFEPFFTTKASGEGSGLGLDIVRRIVDKHGGRIRLESEEGVGTRFAVYLPRTAPPEPGA